MAGIDRAILPLTLNAAVQPAPSGTPLACGVWYDLQAAGVLFRMYVAEQWIKAVADYEELTAAFDWDEADPPFIQRANSLDGVTVELLVTADGSSLTICPNAVDA